MEIIIAAIGKQKQSPELELLTKYVNEYQRSPKEPM